MKFKRGSLYARRTSGMHDINTARNIKVSLDIGKIKAINVGSDEPITPVNERKLQFKIQQEKQRFAKQNQSVTGARRRLGSKLLQNRRLQAMRFDLQQGRRMEGLASAMLVTKAKGRGAKA